MFGVVLWSDNTDRKAVIWCEDHGNLAFYSGQNESAFEGVALDAGDLVHFTLVERRDIRVATEPRLVAEQQYPGLIDRLMSGVAGEQPPAPKATGGKVIAFRPRHGATPAYA